MSQSDIQKLKVKNQHVHDNQHDVNNQVQSQISDSITPHNSEKVVSQANYESLYPMAGSDETGKGDYFGPFIVCAVILEEQQLKLIPVHKIKDSKKMSDQSVLELAPVLMKVLKYELQIVSNAKYNSVHQKHNLNQMNAMLHNHAYLRLKRQHGLPKNIVIDQFTPELSYYHYLKDVPQIITGIRFEKKAEDKFLAVACASIIARYTLLQEFEAMNTKYQFNFPKGAVHVEAKAREFITRFGEKELPNVAKLHFKTTSKVLQK